MRTNRVLGMLSTLLLLSTSPLSYAQYPDRPIRLIVPFGAGGITDLVARQLSRDLAEELGQSVVVENRTGAGGAVGAQVVANSKPDGYTVLMGTVGTQVVNALIMDKLNYDPNAFEPLGLISGSPYVLAVNADLPVDDMMQLIELAKEKKGELTFGSAGVGSSPQLGIELLKYTQQIDILHVPFRSGGEAVTATASGQTHMVMDAIPVVMPHVESGRLKALALASSERSPAAPDLKTSTEQGFDGVRISSWNALFVPKGTPTEVIVTLNSALQKTLKKESLQQAFLKQGSTVYKGTLEEYTDFLDEEREKWKVIVKEANITIN